MTVLQWFLVLVSRHMHVVFYRFDVRRAYKLTLLQKLKEFFGGGGHVYGYGPYFASHALYSHWWGTRGLIGAAKSVFTV